MICGVFIAFLKLFIGKRSAIQFYKYMENYEYKSFLLFFGIRQVLTSDWHLRENLVGADFFRRLRITLNVDRHKVKSILCMTDYDFIATCKGIAGNTGNTSYTTRVGNGVRKTSTTITTGNGSTVTCFPMVASAVSMSDMNWFRIDVALAGSVINAKLTSFADYDMFLFAPCVDEESGQLCDIGQLSNIGEQGDTNILCGIFPPSPTNTKNIERNVNELSGPWNLVLVPHNAAAVRQPFTLTSDVIPPTKPMPVNTSYVILWLNSHFFFLHTKRSKI
jgi:hypothetical protein